MANPAALPLESETEAGRLQRALTDAQTDLQRHSGTLSKLQGELMASRLEVSGIRAETVQYQGFLRRAEMQIAAAHVHAANLETEIARLHAHIEELRAHAGNRDGEIVRLHAHIATLQNEVGQLRTYGDAVRASTSWRITQPLRVVVRLLGRR